MNGTIRDKRRLDDNGEWIVEKEYVLDGEVVNEAEFKEVFPDQEPGQFATSSTSGWPMKSEALAVHSKQIPAVLARNKRHGLNIHYDRVGRPVFTDAGQRKKLMKIEGVVQQNSYYGA